MMDRRSRPLQTSTHNVALRTAAGVGLVAAALVLGGDAHAQTPPRFPFPSSNTTAQRTGSLTTHELRALYQFWKTQFLDDCGDGSIRVQYPENAGSDTRSEGIGYGMVISAYMGDKPTFDGLYAYWQRFDNNNLMNWRTFGGQCGDQSENGSASDADVDAAMGLIIADQQWSGYAAAANAIIGSIRQVEILACNGRDLLDPGSDGGFGSCGCLNPSYFAPAYYQAFAEYNAANAALWNKAVGDAYGTFGSIQNRQSGLVPAWSSAAAAQTQGCNFQVAGGGNENEYQSDAARVPWRVATDLVWTGSQAARTFLTPMVGWLKTSNRITNIVDRFTTAGAALPAFVPNGGGANNTPLDNATLDATGRRSTITMGAFATAGIAGTQDDLDSLVGAWTSLYRAGDNLGAGGAVQAHAFNSSLALLYGMLATGTMWSPLGADPTPLQEPALHDQPGNAIANGDFDEGMLGWSAENLGGAAAEGYAVHKNGELHVLIQKITGAENAQYMVRVKQQVTLQANQNYRISLRARAAEPRLLRVFVGQRDAPYDTYLQMDDDPEADGDGIHLTTEMQTFEVVQAASASSGVVQLALDFADSTAEVVLDDIVLAPTTDPATAPGTVVVPPTTDPGAPATPPPGAPAAGTPGSTGNGTIGTVTPGGDSTGSTGTPAGTAGSPNPIDATAGMPPAPGLAPMSNTCSAANSAVCGAGFMCSVELGLCYDPVTGYVRDPATNDWALPPFGYPGCGPEQVFWPKYNLCYVPDTGYIWNTQTNKWEFYGVDYTEGKERTSDDSGCDVSGAGGERNASSWMLVGLLGAALGLSYRRRSA
jgi:endo-1,4-beta-D-glucanase Y